MSQTHFPALDIGTAAADEFVRLPQLPKLFEKRSQRIASLSNKNALSAFLNFAARVVDAQAFSCGKYPPEHCVEPSQIQRAHDHAMPLLQPDVWLPTHTYRSSLRAIASQIEIAGLPEPTQQTLNALWAATDDHLNALAISYLAKDVSPHLQAEMLFVAAALQVEFAQMAAQFSTAALKPLDAPGLCPMCGSAPVSGIVVADSAYGRRYLHCSLCCTSWHHVRVSCIVCGDEKQIAYHEIKDDNGVSKVETCGACNNYSKLFYQAKDMAVDAMGDDLASLPLDLLVQEEGFERHAPNPFLLVASLD